MKKIFIMFLILMISFSMVIGCNNKPNDNTNNPPTGNNTSTPKDNNKQETGITKIGLGFVNSIASSKDKANDTTPFGQVDTTIAAVAFDKNDKIVKVSIDSVQQKIDFDKDLQITTDLAKDLKSKVELGNDYNMIIASKIGKNWHEQIAELEKWMIGKSINDITAMKTKQVDESHPAVPDIPELTSSVTITVEDYIDAVVDAYEKAVTVGEGATTFGLGHTISISGSKGLADNVNPVAAVDTTMAATAFDQSGKVVRTIIDVMQAQVNFDTEGKVTNRETIQKSKVELGDEYGMKVASKIGKNWHEQIAELEKIMAGKTLEEIKTIPTKSDLTSTVTIGISEYINTVEKSQKNAK